MHEQSSFIWIYIYNACEFFVNSNDAKREERRSLGRKGARFGNFPILIYTFPTPFFVTLKFEGI